MHLAASKGMIELCDLFYEYGGDMSILSPKFGTPLHVAVKLHHKYITQFLLEHGCKLEETNNEGETALHVVAQSGDLQILNLLLTFANKSLYYKKDNEGRTALHVAAMAQKDEVVRIIATKCPSIIPLVDCKGKSALFYMHPRKRNPIRFLFTQHNNNAVLNHHKLFDDKTTSDITLGITGSPSPVCHCHRAVLWARWMGIRERLPTGDPQEALASTLAIPDVEADVLKAFIYYLYTDEMYTHRLKLIPMEEASLLERLRAFAHKQECNFLVGMCNALLRNLSEYSNQNNEYSAVTGNSTYQNDFLQLVGNKMFSDVQIVVLQQKVVANVKVQTKDTEPEHVITAHKALLIPRCDYFKAMFDPGNALIENQSKTVKLEMHKNVVYGVLSYLYSTVVPKTVLNATYATSLLEASNRLMLDGLSLKCQMFLIEHLDNSNVCQLFPLADVLNADILREECLDYLMRNYTDIRKTDDWKHLNKNLKEEVEQFSGI
uniref:BTB domain-containing protein n=1 Tax=Arcella intermedia TaxID=1963864 RepID=A0A6B2L2L7_9EUKA